MSKNKKRGELMVPPTAVTQTGIEIRLGNIVADAQREHIEGQREKIQKQIGIVLQRVETLLPIQRNISMRLNLCERQLAALRNGEFDVNPLNLHIKFRDKTLNVAWDDTAYWGMSDPNEKDDPFRGF